MQKIVIVGAPCSGKSTVLKVLRKKGFFTITELAEPIIKKYMKSHYGIPPWETKDCKWFQKKAFSEQIRTEKKLAKFITKEEFVFLDGGVPDRIAISELEGVPVEKKRYTFTKNNPYSQVFFFEPLPKEKYTPDTHRPIPYKRAKQIGKAIGNIYKKLQYDVIYVPLESPSKRVAYILRRLNG
ncbi:MAG: ATP-binding protein [Candidatus Diapherotrites archaeon]|nr:ATP-binding protein [Candidatus Diapherotrites archaeon]